MNSYQNITDKVKVMNSTEFIDRTWRAVAQGNRYITAIFQGLGIDGDSKRWTDISGKLITNGEIK